VGTRVLRELGGRRQEALVQITAAEGAFKDAGQALGDLGRFARAHRHSVEDLRFRETSAKASVLEVSRKIEVLEAEAEQLDERESALSRATVELLQARVPLEHELGVVAQFRITSPSTRPTGGLGELRETFSTRLRVHKQATADSILQARLDDLEEERQKIEQLLARKTRDRFTPQEVSDALTEALTTVGLEESVARADGDRVTAVRNRGRADQELSSAETAQNEAAKKVAALRRDGIVTDLQRQYAGATADVLWARLDALKRELLWMQREIEDATSARSAVAAEFDAAKVSKSMLDAATQRLSDALPVSGDAKDEEEGHVPLPADEAEAFVSDVLSELRNARKRLEGAQQRLDVAIRALTNFVRDLPRDTIPSRLVDRLTEPEVESLLKRAEGYLSDIELRRETVATLLHDIEMHRSLIAGELQRAADPALSLLNRLESASVFPHHVGGWGGHPFLRVKFSVPGAAAEREALAAGLLDRLVNRSEVPSGRHLIQEMVHELTQAGGLSVHILKPEAHRRLQYLPVEILSKFSGGEKLTAAILLYCTMARLRSDARGGLRMSSSVLLLDNPFGTCSLPGMVELQREMAALHKVQLIYTTGIEDLQALALMPNVVRLLNAHADSRGRRRVTHEPRPVEAVRIARSETPS
jgi:hypothetical protein